MSDDSDLMCYPNNTSIVYRLSLNPTKKCLRIFGHIVKRADVLGDRVIAVGARRAHQRGTSSV
jgi:hypothetical protein